jgi:hypothetical protein
LFNIKEKSTIHSIKDNRRPSASLFKKGFHCTFVFAFCINANWMRASRQVKQMM